MATRPGSRGDVSAFSGSDAVGLKRTKMLGRRLVWVIVLVVGCGRGARGQEVLSNDSYVQRLWQPQIIPLTVPKGTPIQIVVVNETRIRGVGQGVRGRVVQPVYAFDKLVIPTGTEALGRITKIDPIPGKKRALAILNADFTPAHTVELEFDELVLPNGEHLSLSTVVSPGSGQILQLISSAEKGKKTVNEVAAEKIKEAKHQAKQEWEAAMGQVKKPGRMHRLKRRFVAELPIHPQYIDAGTLYFVEVEVPLDFGMEELTPETASSMGTVPPEGSLVRALLVTPLSSATTQKDEEVEAVVSQPLFDGKRLVLPQGSRLKGSVVQVQPARYMHRNGQLRIVLHQLLLPGGVEELVLASLEGIQAAKADNVKLDSEGGAEATSPKTRYLEVAIALGLGVASFGGDADDLINHAAGGANGFGVLGMALGASVRSRSLGYTMGAYGAAMSLYTHFISRGRDVVFPKNTAMEIGIGQRLIPPQMSTKPNSP